MPSSDYFNTPTITGTFISRAKARQKYMEELRQPAEALMTELIDLLLPSSTPFVSSEQEGEETGSEIYLTDPVRYLRTCADGVMGALVSPHFRWFQYQMSHPALRENDDIRKWLQGCEEQMYFMYKKSNFYSILPPHFRYALGIGNSIILKHESTTTGRQVFTCPHPRQNYWLEDDDGRTLPYHRMYEKTVEQILQRFNKKKMSKTFNRAADSGDYYQKFKILHCIYDGNDPIFNGTDINVNRPYMEFYLEYDASEYDTPNPIKQDGYFVNPIAPWRLEKNDDEVYGRGIGHLALADIRGANELEASVITGIHKEVSPPVIAPMSLRGRLEKDADGETYLSPAEMGTTGRSVRELLTRGMNYAPIKDFRAEKLACLREWFAVDYFLQLSNMAMGKTTPPSATQILGMADEKAILLIGRIGRFDSDCFDDLMKSCFLTEFRAGRLPEPPGILYEFGGAMPDVVYLGPLAQAQRRMHSVRKDIDALTSVIPAFEAEPRAKYKVRWPEFVEGTLEKSGFTQEYIVPKEEYDEKMRVLDEQAAQAQQLEMLERVGKAMPGLGKKTDKSSPLAALTGATE